MTIKTTGPLAISELVDEFGGGAPHALSEFYNAGPGVPTSGRIRMLDFYGVRRHPYTRQSVMQFVNGAFTNHRYTDDYEFGDSDHWLGGGCGFLNSTDVPYQTGYSSSGYHVVRGLVLSGYTTTPSNQKILGLYYQNGVGVDGNGGSNTDAYFRNGNGGVGTLPLSGGIRFRYQGTGNSIERIEIIPTAFDGRSPVTLYPSSAQVGYFNQGKGIGNETLMQWNLSYNPFGAGYYYVNMRYY